MSEQEEINVEWYDKLIEDLTKLEFNGTVAIKHAIGKRIVQEKEKFDKEEYGDYKIENIAKDVGVSVGEIYRCTKFVEKYPEFSHVVREFGNMSWHNIAKKYLYEKKEDTEERIKPLTKSEYKQKVKKTIMSMPLSNVPGLEGEWIDRNKLLEELGLDE